MSAYCLGCLSNKIEPAALKSDPPLVVSTTSAVAAPSVVQKHGNTTSSANEIQTRQPRTRAGRPPTSLIGAVKRNDVESIKNFVRSGADVNARGSWETTPLIFACQYGHLEAAKALIELGADTSASNEKNVTALLYYMAGPR